MMCWKRVIIEFLCVSAGDGQRGDGAAAAVSGERHAASPQGQEDGEEESVVCCESHF